MTPDPKTCAYWWRGGWMRAWPKREYPNNIKSFDRAWKAGLRVLELGGKV